VLHRLVTRAKEAKTYANTEIELTIQCANPNWPPTKILCPSWAVLQLLGWDYASARPLQADGHQPESPSMISQPPFLLQLLSQLNADLLLQFN
jgi:hypothetical protein